MAADLRRAMQQWLAAQRGQLAATLFVPLVGLNMHPAGLAVALSRLL